MRKNDYREILSEKFKTASQLQTGPLSEEDEEYLRILAEARAVHAVKKAEREAAQRAAKEASQKRMTTSLAAVVLLAALLTGSYILGLNTDIRASADPDDEIKVVQQGDNIIIGPGVSENDENVGVVTKTYYDIEDVPEEVREEIHLIKGEDVTISKIKVMYGNNRKVYLTVYKDVVGNQVEVREEYNADYNASSNFKILMQHGEKYICKEITVIEQTHDEGIMCIFEYEEVQFTVSIPRELEETKKTIINGLIS